MVIKEYFLEGLRTCDINLLPDERGFFAEALRLDWKDFISDEIVQANMSLTYPGIIRAWHRHVRGQVDYFLVLRGASKICAYSEKTQQLVEIVAGGSRPVLIRMPGYYFHGFKTVDDAFVTQVWHQTTTLYVTVHEGADEKGAVVGKGILHIEPLDFAKQMTTMSVTNAP